MSKIQVKTDAKPPVPRERRRYPWADMKDGQCFYLTDKDPDKLLRIVTSCRVSGMRYFQRRGAKLTVVSTTKGDRTKISVVARKKRA